jgi:hypothetical protein
MAMRRGAGESCEGKIEQINQMHRKQEQSRQQLQSKLSAKQQEKQRIREKLLTLGVPESELPTPSTPSRVPNQSPNPQSPPNPSRERAVGQGRTDPSGQRIVLNSSSAQPGTTQQPDEPPASTKALEQANEAHAQPLHAHTEAVRAATASEESVGPPNGSGTGGSLSSGAEAPGSSSRKRVREKSVDSEEQRADGISEEQALKKKKKQVKSSNADGADDGSTKKKKKKANVTEKNKPSSANSKRQSKEDTDRSKNATAEGADERAKENENAAPLPADKSTDELVESVLNAPIE